MFKKFMRVLTFLVILSMILPNPGAVYAANGDIAGTISNVNADAETTITASDGVNPDISTTITGPGAFLLTGLLPNTTYTVTPSSADYVFDPESNTATTSPSQQVSVGDFYGWFTGGGGGGSYDISGMIALDGGGAVPNVLVVLNETSTTTDENGQYYLEGLEEHTSGTITASLAGYTFTSANNVIEDLTEDMQVDFTAYPNIFTVSGHITLEGAGLENVSVAFNGQTTTTDAQGAYTFADVPASVNSSIVPSSPVYAFTPAEIAVNGLTENKTDGDFTAALAMRTVSGHVTLGGAGLQNVSVAFNGQTTTTDAQGAYAFTNVPSTVNSAIVPSSPIYTFSPTQITINGLSADRTDADFTATLITYPVSGHVTLNSAGLPNISVALNGQTTTTDAQGAYSFPSVPVTVNSAIVPTSPYYTFSPVQIAVNGLTGAKTDGNFTATVNTYTLSGHVTAGGQGLANINVAFNGQTTTTNAQGAYAFANVPATVNSAVVPSSPYYTFSPVQIAVNGMTANRTDADFAATVNTYPVSGHITVGGAGLANISVAFNGQTTTTDAQGAYAFANVPATVNSAIVPTSDYYTFSPLQIAVNGLTAARTDGDFTATVNRHTVSGHVTAGGAGLANISVAFNGQTTTTDAQGAYAFTNVPATVNSAVVPSSLYYTFSPVQIAVNGLTADRTNVDFAATVNRYTVSGHITAGGQGLQNVSVAFNGQTTTTDAQGAYAFTNVPATVNSAVVPSSPIYTFSPVQILVNGLTADRTNADFSATLNTYTVSGHITVGGQGLANISVAFNGQTATTDAQGAYAFTSVPATVNSVIVPSSAIYTFSPTQITVNGLTADKTDGDFTATLNHYTVSGHITLGGQGLANISVAFNGQTDTTDAQGAYAFADVPATVNSAVVPSSPIYTFSPTQIQINGLTADRTNADFTATLNTYTVSGHITVGGQGLANISVAFNGQTTTTNAQGAYSFADVPATVNSTIVPTSTIYSFNPVQIQVNGLTANKTDADFAATMYTYTVSGQLTLEGVGLPDITVAFNGQTATTNAQGVYTFVNVPATVNSLIVPSSLIYTFSPAQIPVNGLVANKTDGNFTATLNLYTVSGHITVGGQGLANISVAFNGQTTTTDAQGAYTFQHVAATVNSAVVPSSPIYTFSPTQIPVNGLTANKTDADFAATLNTYTVSGHITYNSAGLSGVQVALNGQTTTTDAQGAYTFTDIPTTVDSKIVPTRAGYAFSPAEIPLNGLTANKTDANFTAAMMTVQMSGVVKVQGKAVKNVAISAGGNLVMTDAYGRYTLIVQKDVPVTPVAVHSYFTFTGTEVTPTHDFTYDWTSATVIVTGTVLEGETGLENVAIKAGLAKAVTGAGGVYTLTVKDTDVTSLLSFKIVPQATGFYFNPASKAISPTYGKTGKNFKAIRRNFTVSGTVMTATGKKVAGVTVWVGGRKTVTGSYGTYALSIPYDTAVRIQAFKFGYSFVTPAEFTMPAQRIIGQNIAAAKLETPRMITGTVKVSDTGNPLAYVTVKLKYQGFVVKQARTNSKGMFTFSGLVASDGYVVEATRANYIFAYDPAAINLTDANATENISATRVAPINGTISGLPAGTTLAIRVVDGGGNQTLVPVTLKRYSKYTIPNMEVGTYTLTPVLEGYTFTPASRVVIITRTATSVTANFTARH